MVQKWTTSKKVGAMSYWNQVGLGQPGQIDASGKIGRPIEFNQCDKFLTARIEGEVGRPTEDSQLFALDLGTVMF